MKNDIAVAYKHLLQQKLTSQIKDMGFKGRSL